MQQTTVLNIAFLSAAPAAADALFTAPSTPHPHSPCRPCAEEVLERDFFMSAEEACIFGIVDEVIEQRPKTIPEQEQ